MKDVRGVEVVIGNTVAYASGGKQVVALITDFDGEKVTLQKDGGKTSTVAWKDEKFLLVA